MKTNKLLADEKAIEDMIDDLVPVSEDKRKKIENILAQTGKNKSISQKYE
ncbi:MAG TPA: hypothetical protein PLP19_00745 [bacterium]|nr:hypothetical protein [bacterium]HPN41992.1 hypothetical protein [bacterium]